MSVDYTYIPRGAKYKHISTSATTLVRTGPSTLRAIVVNSAGSGATATVYDGVSAAGTVIAVIPSPASAATLRYDCVVSVGICVVTASGTPMDLTVVYEP